MNPSHNLSKYSKSPLCLSLVLVTKYLLSVVSILIGMLLLLTIMKFATFSAKRSGSFFWLMFTFESVMTLFNASLFKYLLASIDWSSFKTNSFLFSNTALNLFSNTALNLPTIDSILVMFSLAYLAISLHITLVKTFFPVPWFPNNTKAVPALKFGFWRIDAIHTKIYL